MNTLACGPFFSEVGAAASLFVLLVVKPLTCFAFIQAFRYRVSRHIPMSYRRAVVLAAIRTGAGVLLIGVAYFVLSAFESPGLVVPWVFLGVERLGAWLALGWFGAALRGRRLVGWTLSAAAIDIAFDAALGFNLGEEWLVSGGILAAVAAFIGTLSVIGRRDSLRARFAHFGRCVSCQYDLTGNLSGRCPECGSPVATDPVLLAA